MRIIPIASTSLQVQFASPAGGAVGTWKGPSRPALGEPVDVEFTIRPVLRWADTRPATEAGFAIERDHVRIRGRIESVDDAGVATLNVAGAPLQIEFTGEAPAKIVGTTIELPEVELQLHPTGV
jgi:hypothetical protein